MLLFNSLADRPESLIRMLKDDRGNLPASPPRSLLEFSYLDRMLFSFHSPVCCEHVVDDACVVLLQCTQFSCNPEPPRSLLEFSYLDRL